MLKSILSQVFSKSRALINQCFHIFRALPECSKSIAYDIPFQLGCLLGNCLCRLFTGFWNRATFHTIMPLCVPPHNIVWNEYKRWLLIYSKYCCHFCMQLPIMQVAYWIISPQLLLYTVLCSRVAFTYIRLSAYIKWPHYCLSSVPVLFCCCLLLTLRVIVSFPVDSSHVSLGASLFSAAPSRLRLKTVLYLPTILCSFTAEFCCWAGVSNGLRSRMRLRKTAWECDQQLWLFNAKCLLLRSQSIELEHTVPAFIDVYADDV